MNWRLLTWKYIAGFHVILSTVSAVSAQRR